VIVSLEQQVMSNLGLQVNYVHKAGYDYPGWQDVGGKYAQVPYIDSAGVGRRTTVMVYKLLTPFSQSVFQMTNVAGLFSKYNGVTITAPNACRATAGHDVARTLEIGRAGAVEHPRRGFGSKRHLRHVRDDRPRRHQRRPERPRQHRWPADRGSARVAKAQLIYKLPWNFLVSGNLQHQTGRPWARQVRVGGLGFPSSPTIYMEPLDGSRRVPSLDLIDARVQRRSPSVQAAPIWICSSTCST